MLFGSVSKSYALIYPGLFLGIQPRCRYCLPRGHLASAWHRQPAGSILATLFREFSFTAVTLINRSRFRGISLRCRARRRTAHKARGGPRNGQVVLHRRTGVLASQSGDSSQGIIVVSFTRASGNPINRYLNGVVSRVVLSVKQNNVHFLTRLL
jgi:hypothetical protein